MPDHTCPCPKCGHPARFVGSFDPHVATWNCDEDSCKMGGFSEYVWPSRKHPAGFRRLNDMIGIQLAIALETARTADYPELVSALEKELASRSQLADAAGRSAGR